jgi:fused signal recognition particle receptor
MGWFNRKGKKEPEPQDKEEATTQEPEPKPEPEIESPSKQGFLNRLMRGLSKTRENLVQGMDRLFAGKKVIDADLLEELEELLITSDLGVATTMELIQRTQKMVDRKELSEPSALKAFLQEEIFNLLQLEAEPLSWERKPLVIMIIGVNGTGKTTTIGKLAAQLKATGKNVLLVAADTFRAAAVEQLEIWGERANCAVIKQKSGADPAAVAFDGIQAALSRQVDIVIIDTAGRLHTKINLMEELKKMQRIIGRQIEGAPHEVLLVLDATTGQNALSQAKMFHEAIGVTGLILTKLDGTAKGGIVVGIAREMNIPVRFIGVGEDIEDLREFNSREFTEALFKT